MSKKQTEMIYNEAPGRIGETKLRVIAAITEPNAIQAAVALDP